RLNNNFTHKLSIVEHLLDGTPQQVIGTSRNDMEKAPIVSGVHHFLKRREFIPSQDKLNSVEWGEVNAEWSYTIMAEFQSPYALKPISVLFKHSALHPRFNDDHIVIYGEEGAITITGCYGQGDLFIYNSHTGWEKQSVPPHIANQLPPIDDDTQRNWTVLMQEFVASIQGLPHQPYQTFADGWRYQDIIDHIRANKAWYSTM
ncbi:MAG: gfo/Idh/MocA family oxidoreductase, partial [Chloroflexi bacterium]